MEWTAGHTPDNQQCYTISTSNWMPYDWSTNNVAHEEVMNMVLAYFIAGRRNEGFRLLKATSSTACSSGLVPETSDR